MLREKLRLVRIAREINPDKHKYLPIINISFSIITDRYSPVKGKTFYSSIENLLCLVLAAIEKKVMHKSAYGLLSSPSAVYHLLFFLSL